MFHLSFYILSDVKIKFDRSSLIPGVVENPEFWYSIVIHIYIIITWRFTATSLFTLSGGSGGGGGDDGGGGGGGV